MPRAHMHAGSDASISSQAQKRDGFSRYNAVFEFDYPFNGRPATWRLTSIAGHLMGLEFDERFKGWKARALAPCVCWVRIRWDRLSSPTHPPIAHGSRRGSHLHRVDNTRVRTVVSSVP